MWNWISGSKDTPKEVESPDAPTCVDDENAQGDEHPTENNSSAASETTNSVKLQDTAASVGSFLYTVASAATKTASKLKDSVDNKLEKTIIGDFQRENDKFVQEKRSKMKEEPVPPWVGYLEEEEMKSQILSLSTDDRNFLRDPPNGVDFNFDLEILMPVALATLQEDKNLSNMRFKLVPKKLKEERFWRNYFYRVSLIKQKSQLNRLAESENKRLTNAGSVEKLENVTESPQQTSLESSAPKDIVVVEMSSALEEIVPDSPTAHEFVSDSFANEQHHGLSVDEMSQLNMKDKEDTAPQWEQELQNELQDFEFVSEGGVQADDEPDPNWEKEIEDMLGLEND